jgi:urease accessory protein UreE
MGTASVVVMDLAHAVVAQHLAAHATDRQFTSAPDEVAETALRAARRAERVAAARARRARTLTERGRHVAPRPARA